jgi:hypothetical protein
MAKKKKKAAAKSDVNKSQAVRDYLKTHRSAKPQAVSTALKEQGIDVTPQTVSTVKFNMKKKKGRKKPVSRKAAASRQDDIVSMSALLEAKKLVDKIGSIEQTKAAVEALRKLS